MLSSIYIKNFAIIDELEIDFHNNMSVLTGETGAGKSILIDAINIVFGNKKTNKVIRNEQFDTEIICQFNISNKNIIKILEEKDLADSNECIFRRKINKKNISKIYINDKPVNSSTAKSIGSLIIDIHGQHENQLILSDDEQRNRLDNFINIKEDKLLIQKIISDINAIKKYLSENSLDIDQYQSSVSLLEYEIKELENEVIDAEEYNKISEEYKKLSNSEILKNKVYQCLDIIENTSEQDITSMLSNINKNLIDINNIDQNANNLLDININIQDEVKSLSKLLEKYTNSINCDEEKLVMLNEKILSLNNLAKKYNSSESELQIILTDKIKKLDNLKNSKSNIEENKNKINKNLVDYHKISEKISKIRKQKAVILEKKITNNLKKLGMNDCEFKIDILSDKNIITKNGYDKVSFLIKTNKKSKLLPLKEIASGGELSRLSLVIQLETRSNDDCETMIFDEIDTGIGGATAEILGNHLTKLSEKTQVLCVTHLAQIAAKSSHHYLVSKDKNISATKLKYLNNEERVKEIARMIGGLEITEKTLQFAKELID